MNSVKLDSIFKRYDRSFCLSNFSYSFSENKLYAIMGESGCGKTTLLNIISGNIKPKGKVFINQKDIYSLKEKELEDFRLRKIGYVYQDFKLIENETVFSNLSLLINGSYSVEDYDSYIDDLLLLVGLKDKKNSYVSLLSGGEKQRVAIARALCNGPDILLADEPTGALDNITSEIIMDLLKRLSSSIPIIIVTHDESIAEKYADEILYLKEGKLIKSKKKETHELENVLLLRKPFKENRASKIPLRFLLSHSFKNLKKKKIKSFFCFLVTSFSLLSIGLSFSITDIVSSNIQNSYSMIIGENRLNITSKKESIIKKMSINLNDGLYIKEKYGKYIYDIGYCYSCNFENYFKDTNEFVLKDTFSRAPLEGFSARNINEYRWLDLYDGEIYPKRPKELKKDEIVISLDEFSLNNLCTLLNIKRTRDSLASYLDKKTINLVLDVCNEDWQYEDEQTFSIVGFCFDVIPSIFHYDHFWNEKIFEEQMRFPTNADYDEKEYYPWVMKKLAYLEVKDKENFLKEIRYDDRFQNYIFELGNSEYYPYLFKDEIPKNISRIFPFKQENDLCFSDISYLKKIDKSLDKLLIGTNGAYGIYPDSFLMGFNETMLISFSEEMINQSIDALEEYKNAGELKFNGVEISNFAQSNLSGFKFNVGVENFAFGEKAKNIDEICVSKELISSLGENENCLDKEIFISYPYSFYRNNKGNTILIYRNVPIKIVGIYEGYGKKSISQSENWLIDFFLLRIGISGFSLVPNAFSFVSENVNEHSINLLEKSFPNLNFKNSEKEVKDSINYVSSLLSSIFFILSFITTISSILLILFSSYVDYLESKKELTLLNRIGFSKKESIRTIGFNNAILIFMSLIFSIFELILSTTIISYFINGKFEFRINLFSILSMVFLSLFLIILFTFFLKMKIRKNQSCS